MTIQRSELLVPSIVYSTCETHANNRIYVTKRINCQQGKHTYKDGTKSRIRIERNRSESRVNTAG